MTGVGGGGRPERMPREGNAEEKGGEPTRREREHKSSLVPNALGAASCSLSRRKGFSFDCA